MSKLLVLLLIIAVVWYGFKIFTRRSRPVGQDRETGRIRGNAAEEEKSTVHDMETCSVCGTFVPTAAARACGRDGCPYPA